MIPMKKQSDLQVAIAGRPQFTHNYEFILRTLGVSPKVTLSLGELESCEFLILPGGGDITPAFFGQKNKGSKNIDTELDILQIQALDLFVRLKKPVLGICKGMQLINVFFGGSILQHLPTACIHAYQEGDRFHTTRTIDGSILHQLYGEHCMVNSAHHQGISIPGKQLTVIQTSEDDVIEGIRHEHLPILGVQWHPERLLVLPDDSPEAKLQKKTAVDGSLLFQEFLSGSV